MTDTNLHGKEAMDKLHKIVDEVKVCMMNTITGTGMIHSRPMATAGVDDDGTLWFFTRRSSEKVEELENEHGICLSYSKPSDNSYATILGTAVMIDDKDKEQQLWNPMLKAWFPEGTDDPDLTLISVRPFQGEYWDSNSSRMITFLKIASAAVTGNKYGEEDHGKMKL